jgi:uncharacterized protein YdeI (YjbR/CyaY-like superfamily)
MVLGAMSGVNTPAPSPDGRVVLIFENAAGFDAWLEDNHDDVDGIWIQMAKVGSGHTSITWADAVPVAICHGWIDGQARRVDDSWYLQRFTPRRPRSTWSQVNVSHAERLIAEAKMRPWGLEQVERAKADGRWDAAYQPSSSRDIPIELEKALEESPAASAAFAELDSRNRYAMVLRIQTAKRQETRVRNAARFVEMLERGDRIH